MLKIGEKKFPSTYIRKNKKDAYVFQTNIAGSRVSLGIAKEVLKDYLQTEGR